VKITKTTVDAAWRRRPEDGRPKKGGEAKGGVAADARSARRLPKGTRLVVADAGCGGLALIVTSGTMTWSYSYKPRGTDPLTGKRFSTRSVTIGNPETHSPDDAREAANRLKGEAKAGLDPAAQRRARLSREAADRARTAGRLLEEYGRTLAVRPKLRGSGTLSRRVAAEELANARAAVAAMRAEDKPVAELTAVDLRALLRTTAGHPAAARHRFGALSRFFDWCHEEGHVAANPCALVARARRPRAVPPRQHVLKPAELALLWRAAGEADGLEPVHRDFVRFLIAVPCRRGEAANLDWAHLDLDAGLWRQPGTMTKNGDTHNFHLHRLALDLLRERHAAAGEPKGGLVFPAPRSGKAITTFSAIKRALDAKAEMTGWRVHDCRRSFATAMGEAGIPEPVADAVLNHRQAATRGGVLGVYQRARRWPEQVEAMNAWGALLEAAIEGGPTPTDSRPEASAVVDLHRARIARRGAGRS
jgi:integrase